MAAQGTRTETASSEPLLLAEDLVTEFRVRGSVLRAVDGVTLEVRRGETVALIGESGCGKSTLGRTILRLVEPRAGRILLDGTDVTFARGRHLRTFRRRVQMVFQDPFSSLDPRMRVGAIVREGLDIHGILPPARRDRRVREYLEAVGLPPSASGRFPHEFSGGQRQRIGIARALAVEPELIVADEPVSALDVSVQAQVMNLLADLRRRFHLAYLFITHDLRLVANFADRLAVMHLGRIVETGPADAVVARPLHPYTRSLLAAVPVPDPALGRAFPQVAAGEAPSPLRPPPGCALNRRCPEALPRCQMERPVLRDLGGGHRLACWRREP